MGSILGIDEVGRGPWAGPLVVGAVVLGDATLEKWRPLNDSKKLTPKKREALNKQILKDAVATGLGWVSADELDKIGLSEALKLATRRAVANISRETYSEIIIDGTNNFLKGTDLEKLVTVLPEADAKIKEVSAASIIAKVARDDYMIKLSEEYPNYGFNKHVGYGTASHKAALAEYGPCDEHRFSFRPVAELIIEAGSTSKWPERIGSVKPNAPDKGTKFSSSTIGKKAEDIVAKYLEGQGHKILARNHKTRFYEIDIVSATKNHVYFTEVKYRKNDVHGEPLEYVDKKKKQQMAFAANSFMKYLAKKLNRDIDDLPSPILAAAAVEGEEFNLKKWFEIDA